MSTETEGGFYAHFFVFDSRFDKLQRFLVGDCNSSWSAIPFSTSSNTFISRVLYFSTEVDRSKYEVKVTELNVSNNIAANLNAPVLAAKGDQKG